MKTERRHELQHNELATWLNTGADKTRPYVMGITLSVVGAFLLLALYLFFSGFRQERVNEAWDAYYVAADSGADEEELLKVAEDYPSTSAADWARLAAADQEFTRGMNLLFTNREAAETHLKSASSAYEALVTDTRNDFIRDRANFSLGQTYEGLSQPDKAKEQYAAVDGVLSEAAQQRVKDLESNPELKGFYQWFAKAELPARVSPLDSQKDPLKLFDLDDPADSPYRLPDQLGEFDETNDDLAFPDSKLDPAGDTPLKDTPAADSADTSPDAPNLDEPQQDAAKPAAPENKTPAKDGSDGK